MTNDQLAGIVQDGIGRLPSQSDRATIEVKFTTTSDLAAAAALDVLWVSYSFLRLVWRSCVFGVVAYRASFDAYRRYLETGLLPALAEQDPRIGPLHASVDEAIRSPGGKLSSPVGISGEEEVQARGAFLRAVSWVFYHEIAHLELGHGASTPEREMEADDYATEQMQRWPEEEDGGLSTRIGIGLACVAIITLDPDPVGAGLTHPSSLNRLLRVASHLGPSENDDVYLFLTPQLMREALSRGVYEPTKGELSSLREAFLRQLELLKTVGRARA